jgi:hypothetical protein
MSRDRISQSLFEELRAVDTPTVCETIEVAQGKRGFNRSTKGTGFHFKPECPLWPAGGCGADRRSGTTTGGLGENLCPAIGVFRTMVRDLMPTAAANEDVDYPNCIAVWWGKTHAAIYKGWS